MALSDADAARLALLQAAYDKLITGRAVAAVDYAGTRTQYSQASIPTLMAEIDKLLAAQANTAGRTRGAIGVRL